MKTLKKLFKKDTSSTDRELSTGDANASSSATVLPSVSPRHQASHVAELLGNLPPPSAAHPAGAFGPSSSSPFAFANPQLQVKSQQVTITSTGSPCRGARSSALGTQNSLLSTFDERNSLPGAAGGPRGSMELAELPAVAYLAQAEFTRAVSNNIKSLAHARSGFGPSSIPNSPSGSQLCNPSSPSLRTSANPSSLRGRTSTLTSRAAQEGGAPGPRSELNSASMPRGAQRLALSSPMASLDAANFGTADEYAAPEGPVPSVVPPALLLEASRSGVDLQMDMCADIVIAADAAPLGRGTAGTVYRATCRGVPCAVKVLPPDLLFGPGTAELHTFVQEMVVLASVRHPNVVGFMGGSLQPPNVFLVEELCPTSLEMWLHGKGGSQPMSTWQRLKVALDVATGLQYLHDRTPAVVHRDLKPANILIDANGTAKISDFGLARVKTHAVINTKARTVGSIGYMPPECFTSENGEVSDKCDTWSLGVVLWECVTRKRPWPGATLPEYYRAVVIKKNRLELPNDDNVCPMALRRLISSCWCDVPEERPSCGHIVAELTRILKYSPRDA